MVKKYIVKNLVSGTYFLSNVEGWGKGNLWGILTPHLFDTFESAELLIEKQPDSIFQIQTVYVK